MADQATSRIGELKHALEFVGQASADRTREIAAVLRLVRTALPGEPAGDVADGIDAAMRLLGDLDGAIHGAIRRVHACGPR